MKKNTKVVDLEKLLEDGKLSKVDYDWIRAGGTSAKEEELKSNTEMLEQMMNSKYGVVPNKNKWEIKKKRRSPIDFAAYIAGQIIGLALVVFITTIVLAAMWNIWLWLT